MPKSEEPGSKKSESERLPGEPTLKYRKRLLPSYKAGRRAKELARQELRELRIRQATLDLAQHKEDLNGLLDRILAKC